MPQQGTRRDLQETSHLDEWLDLREIPNHVLIALRVRNQRPDVVLQQPLDELVRTTSGRDRKSTRLNSSHMSISYAVFCLKKKRKKQDSSNYIRRIGTS